MAVLHGLMRNPIEGESIEFNDNRLSLYSAQKGKCAVTGNQMDIDEVVCIRKIPKEHGGTDKYGTLLLVCRKVQELLHIEDTDTFTVEMGKLNLGAKRSEKLLKLRSLAFAFFIRFYAKMGAGTNVQDRLIALHHLDIPWRPAEEERAKRYITT